MLKSLTLLIILISAFLTSDQDTTKKVKPTEKKIEIKREVQKQQAVNAKLDEIIKKAEAKNDTIK